MNFRSRLTDEQFAVFAELSTPHRYRHHDRIPEAVGLMTVGAVRHGAVFYGEGDLVGLEDCFLSGELESSNDRAYVNVYAGLLQMPYEVFRRFATETAPLPVMQEQAARAKKAFLERTRMTMPVQDRLGTYLMDLASRFGHGSYGVTLGIELTQDQIAQAIGASRPAVEKQLRWLREHGYVQTRYRTMWLTPKFMAGGPKGTWCS